MTIRSNFLAPLALLLAAASAHAEPLVYVTNLYQQFGTLSLATGHFNAIGPGLPDGGAGLVPGSGGSLLTLTVNGDLEAIDPGTGISSIVGATGIGGNANTLAEVNGALYATDLANNLYHVDGATGASTLIGATGIPGAPAYPFTTNPDGSINLFDESLYGVGSNLYATFDAFQLSPDGTSVTPVVTANLWQIDTTTGAATLIAPTVLQILSAVEIDGVHYDLRGSVSVADPFPGAWNSETLDLTTGTTTFLSHIDAEAGPIFAMSPVPAATPTPEPSSLALLGTGLVTLAARFRRR